MASATITWVPAGGVSTSQDIQYKASTSGIWITYASVGPTISTATIPGLIDNVIYDFRIVDDCSYGGPSPSGEDHKIKITCPIVTITPTYNTVGYSFVHLGGSISKYVVELLNSVGATLATNTHTSPTGTITGTFTSLIPTTSYKIRVTVYAGPSFTFNNVCSAQNFTTGAPPVCNPPTGVSATIS